MVEDNLTHCQNNSNEIETTRRITTTTTTATTTTTIDISVDPDLCSSVIYITDGDLEHGQEQLELIKKDAEQFHNCESCRAALIRVKIIFNKIINHLIKKLVNNFIHKIFTLIFDAKQISRQGYYPYASYTRILLKIGRIQKSEI